MASNLLIAFLFSVGAAAWIYAMVYRSSGNNTKSAATVAGISGALLFILTIIVLGMIFRGE